MVLSLSDIFVMKIPGIPKKHWSRFLKSISQTAFSARSHSNSLHWSLYSASTDLSPQSCKCSRKNNS